MLELLMTMGKVKPIPPDIYTWTKLDSGILPNLQYHSMVGHGEDIYFLGGLTNPNTANALFLRYNTNTKIWTKLNCPLSYRFNVGLVVRNSKIYVVGGNSPGSAYLNEVWSWTIGTDEWIRLANTPVIADVRSHVIHGDNIYAVGGYDGTKPVTTTSVYNITTNTWSNRSALPEGRYGGAAVILNNVLYYMFGKGVAINGNTGRRTIYALPLDNGVWTEVPGVISNGVADMASCQMGTKAYLFGGRISSTNNNDMFSFNGVKLSDGAKTIPWPSVGYNRVMLAHAGKLYLSGGYNGGALNDFWECTVTN